jgi:hypothetical protein
MADEKLLHNHCDTSPQPWRGCGDTSNDMTEGYFWPSRGVTCAALNVLVPSIH